MVDAVVEAAVSLVVAPRWEQAVSAVMVRAVGTLTLWMMTHGLISSQ